MQLNKKILAKVSKSIFFVSLKSLGAIVFSFVLIAQHGDDAHITVMERISLILGFSLLGRFGLDQAILKHGVNLLRINDHAFKEYFSGIFIRVSLISLPLGLVLSLITGDLKDIIWLVLVDICFIYLSVIKVKGFAEYSSMLEVGFFLLIATIFISIINVGSSNIIDIVILSWLLIILPCILLYPPRILFRYKDKDVVMAYEDIYPRLSVLSINSLVNYFSTWGVILLASYVYNSSDASDFTLALRLCACFSVVMVAINAFVVPKLKMNFDNGIEIINNYLKSFRALYSSCALLGFFSLVIGVIVLNTYVKSVPLISLNLIVIISIGFAFNLATGPTAMMMMIVGDEKKLLIIRLITLLTLLIATYILPSDSFAMLFTIYLISQSAWMLIHLKINHKLKITYF